MERTADGTEQDITDELPFDVPESWEWVRLGDIMNVVSARRVHQADWKKTGIPFFRAREIAKLAEFGRVENELFISQDLYNAFSKSGVPQENDLMVTAVGTIGKTYVVKKGEVFYYKDASVVCFENFANINSEYIKLLMESPYMREQIKDNSAGTTVDTITIIKANQYLVVLPPLVEQQRIVARIEELLPHIADYDVAEQKLTALNATFPDQLKKSILQAAVQGKLIPQDPADEPASVLLERIRAEKEAQIKTGKIKRDKRESVIFRRDNSHYEIRNGVEVCIDDELPFDIPESWAWTRLGTLIQLFSGQDMTPDKYNADEQGIPYLTGASNIENGSVVINRWTTEPKSIAVQGDLLITCKGTIGTMAFLQCEKVHIARQIMSIRMTTPLCFKYVYYFLETYVSALKAAAKSMIPGISREDILTALVPLPPLAEQYRIVEQTGLILAICDSL